MASRCCRSCRSTRPNRAWPATTRTRTRRFSKAWFRLKRRRAAGRLPLSAQRQPAGHREILHTSSNGCRGFLSTQNSGLKTEEPLVLAGDFNVIPAAGTSTTRRLGQRRPVPPAHPRKLPVAARPRTDRRAARRHRRSGPIHLLGLSGRRLAEEPRLAHRSSAAVAAGQRPADRCRGR